MSALPLLGIVIPSSVYVSGKNNVDVFLVLMVAVVDVVEDIVVRMVQFFNKR